jgi:hypothetical protein
MVKKAGAVNHRRAAALMVAGDSWNHGQRLGFSSWGGGSNPVGHKIDQEEAEPRRRTAAPEMPGDGRIDQQ